MQVAELKIDRKEARELYREYKAHSHYSTPIDAEIRRAYQAIAQGQMVIQALESVKRAGFDARGLPKLAIARADAKWLRVDMSGDGSAVMKNSDSSGRSPNVRFEWGPATFPTFTYAERKWADCRAEAMVPLVPLHLRPQAALENYHILWEAEWSKVPPRDPFLLRRLGKGDLWLVLAHWDLTEVERAALATRVHAA